MISSRSTRRTNLGSSGGPTFDLNGDAIGINPALWRTPGDSGGFLGIGFAIPAATANTIVAQLRERGSVVRASLGVQLRAAIDAAADRARRLEHDAKISALGSNF